MADTTVSITNQNAQGVAPIDVKTVTTGAGTVGREAVVIGDPTTGGNVASVTAIGLSVDTTVTNQDMNITGQTGQSTLNNNIVLATAGSSATDANGYRAVSIEIIGSSGISAGAVSFEASNDNVNFVAIALSDEATPSADPVTTVTVAASTVRYFKGPLAWRYFRARISTAFVGGTVAAITRFMQIAYSEDQITVVQSTASQLNMTVGAALPAGAALIGSIQVRGQAANGGVTYRLNSATIATGVNVKSAVGTVYGFSFLNTTASIRYVHFYAKATAPVLGTDTPVITIGIPASGTAVWEMTVGMASANGIGFTITSDNIAIPVTAGSTGDVVGTIIYV